jgi:homospermidine synthase
LTIALTPDNYLAVLDPLLAPGDFVLNLSVDVSSVAIMQLCQAKQCCTWTL